MTNETLVCMLGGYNTQIVFAFALLWAGLAFVLASRFNFAIFFALLSVALSWYVNLIEPRVLIYLTLLASVTVLSIRYHDNSDRAAYFRFSLSLLILVSLGIGFHAFGGFNNPLVMEKEIISNGAIPFTLYWNYDKAMLAFCLVFYYKKTTRRKCLNHDGLIKSIIALLATIAFCLSLAELLGLIRWEPKIPELFFFWALSNLMITSASEEAFFRGIIQFELQRRLKGVTPHAGVIALGAAGSLFGIAHFAMGMPYVVVAIAAGIGYGLVFKLSGRLEASIVAHFLLNTMHILLFTYPMLAAV